MEELIKEAEGLYWQIDKVIWNLIATRENKDDEGKKKAISDMETIMCGTQQFLKCILERKDNIVDLGEVWYWYKDEKPRNVDDPCVFVVDGIPIADVNNMISLERFVDSCFVNEIKAHSIRWAYVEDLLPKGDNK